MCERLGMDVESFGWGIGSDPRTAESFIHSRADFGDSCFPRDIRALVTKAEEARLNPSR